MIFGFYRRVSAERNNLNERGRGFVRRGRTPFYLGGTHGLPDALGPELQLYSLTINVRNHTVVPTAMEAQPDENK